MFHAACACEVASAKTIVNAAAQRQNDLTIMSQPPDEEKQCANYQTARRRGTCLDASWNRALRHFPPDANSSTAQLSDKTDAA